MMSRFLLLFVLLFSTQNCNPSTDEELSEGSADVDYEGVGGYGWPTECTKANTLGTPDTHYRGPALSTPLAAGKKWGVTVPVGGVYGEIKNTDGTTTALRDIWHAGKDYYAIDFDDEYVGSGGDLTGRHEVEVVAAAPGTVVDTLDGTCTEGASSCSKEALAVLAKKKNTACRVVIDHGDGYKTTYLHMKLYSVAVTSGQHVERGQKLGIVGNTGFSCGAHVHFAVQHERNGCRDNPHLRGITLDGRSWEDYQVDHYYLSKNGFTFLESVDNPEFCRADQLGAWCAQAANFKNGERMITTTVIEKNEQPYCAYAVFKIGNLSAESRSETCFEKNEQTPTRVSTAFTPYENSKEWRLQIFTRLRINQNYPTFPTIEKKFTISTSGTPIAPPPLQPPPPPPNTSTTSYTYAGDYNVCGVPWVASGNPPLDYGCARSLVSFGVGMTVYPKLKLYYLAPLTRYNFVYELYRGSTMIRTFETLPVDTGYGGASPVFALPSFTPDSGGLWTVRIKIRIQSAYASFTIQDVRVSVQ